MTLSKNAETGISLAIPENSAEISLLSRRMPSYTELYHRGISRDIPLQESYPCISQNNFSIPTHTGISRDKSYVGLSRDIPVYAGYGRVSLFQMTSLDLAG